MLSLGDLLRDLEVRVLCGESALDVPVRWVHISELDDPTPFLSGGELLLTTGLGLGTEEEQRAYVRRLARHGLAGLGVGVGFGLDAVPDAMVEEAGACGLALIEVPYALPFIAVTEKAFARLVNEQYAVLQRSIAAQERLQRIVLSDGGLDAVAQAICGLIGGSVLIYDARGEISARHGFRRTLEEPVVEEITDEIRERTQRSGARGFAPAAQELAARGLALPVASVGGPADARPQAWIVGIKDGEGLTEFDRLVLHQAVTAIAIELLRRRVAGSTERRLAGDVLAAALSGELVGDELARRLAPFGLGGNLTALVLRVEGRRDQAQLEQALEAALDDEAVSALVASAEGLAVALMPGYLDDELLALAERLHGRVTRVLGTPPEAGVGRAAPLARAREAFHEARCAMEARRLGGVPGAGPVATHRELGSFALLLALQDSDALAMFCDALLDPIEAGEGHYGGELMRSLEAFIEANGQWEAAARRLFCHRHTLRYRIRKVEELTGRDLSSARDRIEFWLALRGRDIAGAGTRAAIFERPSAALSSIPSTTRS